MVGNLQESLPLDIYMVSWRVMLCTHVCTCTRTRRRCHLAAVNGNATPTKGEQRSEMLDSGYLATLRISAVRKVQIDLTSEPLTQSPLLCSLCICWTTRGGLQILRGCRLQDVSGVTASNAVLCSLHVVLVSRVGE